MAKKKKVKAKKKAKKIIENIQEKDEDSEEEFADYEKEDGFGDFLKQYHSSEEDDYEDESWTEGGTAEWKEEEF